MAYLPQYQDPTQAPNGVTTSLVNTNLNQVRFYPGYSNINQNQPIGWRTYHSIQVVVEPPPEERLLVRLQRHDQPVRQAVSRTLRLQHNPDGTITVRADQAQADEMLGDNHPQTHIMRAQLHLAAAAHHGEHQPAMKAIGCVANDWSLAGIWSGQTGTAYSVGFDVHERRRQPEPDRLARLSRARVVSSATPGRLQFEPATSSSTRRRSRARRPTASVSNRATATCKGCFVSSLDLSISRVIRLGKGRTRLSCAWTCSTRSIRPAITNRNTTMQLTEPDDADGPSRTCRTTPTGT